MIKSGYSQEDLARMGPDELTKRRLLAEALLSDASKQRKIEHPLQGMAQMAEALMGGLRMRRLDQAQASGQSAADKVWGGIFGGGSPVSSSQPSEPNIPMPGAAGEVAATDPVNISGSKADFINSILPSAIEQGKRTGIDPRIIVAQAAHESGWGQHAPGNNLFGIKSHGQPGGQKLWTNEVVNGKTVRVQDDFRKYDDPAASLSGYSDFILENPRYGKFRSAQGLDAQLAELGASGYASDPNYTNAVGKIARGITLPTASPVVDAGNAPGDASTPPQQTQVADNSKLGAALTGGGPSQEQLMSIISNPWMSDERKKIAQMLLGQRIEQQNAIRDQQMKQADPAYQMQLEKNRLELEAMRNPRPDIPDSVQALDLRAQRAGLQPGTPEYADFMRSGGGGGVTVNNMGNIPAGYQVQYDEAGRPVAMAPVPGSPAAVEAQQATDKAGMRKDQASVSSDTIINAAKLAREAVSGGILPTTGTLGRAVSSVVSESNAAEVYRQVEALKSIAASENINAMRQSSPTGGALGNTSDADLALLKQKAGALDPGAGYTRFAAALNDYERTLLRVVHGKEAGDAIFEKSRTVSPSQTGEIPLEDLLKKYGD